MKRCSLILVVIFLISIGQSFGQEVVKGKTKAQQEKELQIQKTIDEQKKAMADQKKAQSEADAAIEVQKATDTEKANEIEVKVQSTGRGGDVRVFGPRGNRTFTNGDPFQFSAQGIDIFNGRGGGGDTERTTWDFSRTVKENTFSRDYTFDVEKTAKTVVMSVDGDCKAGEIGIKIVMPNGKTYSDNVIDELGNLNWRRSFTVSDTENQDKTGSWKFQVTSTKATGFFKISLQIY